MIPCTSYPFSSRSSALHGIRGDQIGQESHSQIRPILTGDSCWKSLLSMDAVIRQQLNLKMGTAGDDDEDETNQKSGQLSYS